MASDDVYPRWAYFPRNARPPKWVGDLVARVHAAESAIGTVAQRGLDSDAVLAQLRPGLQELGFEVEQSKRRDDLIRRPVLFADDGREEVAYEIDAFHDGLGIAVEVEAGRGAQNNGDYRDIIRASLILDARYLALLMPQVYRFNNGGREQRVLAYANSRDLLDAIYASRRLQLPFEGILLAGY